jgi:ABC-2 type transport system permease protein
MHPILILLRKDIRNFLRYRSSLVITFLVPIILIWLFGFVFGINKKDTGPSGISVAIVNQSGDPSAAVLIKALQEEKTFFIITETVEKGGGRHPITEAEARAALNNNDYRFAVILPSDFTSDDRIGLRVQFLQNPRNDIETQVVTGMLQKTLFTKVPDILGKSLQRRAEKYLGKDKLSGFNRRIADNIADNFGGDREKIYQDISKGEIVTPPEGKPAPDATLRRLDKDAPAPAGSGTAAATEQPAKTNSAEDLLSKVMKFETEQVAGKQVKNPMAARLIGGYAIMFLLFAVSGFSSSFFEERRTGIFQRVLATSATRGHIIFSKFLFCVLLGMFQIGTLLVFGNALYHIDLLQHAVPLFFVVLCASAACASFGMLIAAVSATPHAANSLATLLVLIMSSIGGAWFPITFMPAFIQKISKLTVVYWSVEGITNILWADYGLIRCLPVIGVLLLITALCQGLAVWRFRKGNMFE